MRIFALVLATSATLVALGCDNMNRGTTTPPATTPSTTTPSTGSTHAPAPTTSATPAPSTSPATPSDATVPSPTDSQTGAGVDKGAVDSTGAVREVEPKPSEK